MNVPEPRQTRFDLRWRFLGTRFRATPLFWAAVAVLGIRYYADPEAGSLGYFAFWMVAAVSAVLLHVLGQTLAGRFFAMRGDVVLYGLGSLTMGAGKLSRRWQRVVVLLAGSLIQFIFVAAIWGLTWVHYPDLFGSAQLRSSIGNGAAILLRAHYYWSLLNLLPIWPLDGGRIACEIGEGLFGRRGRSAALGLSLVACAAVAIFVTLELSVHLDFRYDPRYILYLEQFTVLLVFCFLFWIRSVQALWPSRQSSV